MNTDFLEKARLRAKFVMAQRFTESMKTWAKQGFNVSKEAYEKRIAICKTCEFWDDSALAGYGKCLKCGCGRGKHWLPHEKCPIDKWGIEPLTPPQAV
jgi:hypothetical protein